MQDNSNKKSLIKQNISTYLRYKGLSDFQCYKDTGITRGVLSQDNGISEENLMRFLAFYTEVNPTWLVTSRGEMILDKEEKKLAISANVGNNGSNLFINSPKAKCTSSNDLNPDYKQLISELSLQLKVKDEQIFSYQKQINSLLQLLMSKDKM